MSYLYIATIREREREGERERENKIETSTCTSCRGIAQHLILLASVVAVHQGMSGISGFGAATPKGPFSPFSFSVGGPYTTT